MSINSSISRVRSLLLNPKANAPTPDQLFTSLTMEYQTFYNELDASGQVWSFNEQTININSGTIDYLVTNPTGKILFVLAYPQNAYFGPVSLEFADLAGISSDFFLYSPLDYGFSPDFNEAINFPFPFQIAFYRKDGDLWFKLPPFAYALTAIKIVYSTGDWLTNLNTESTAVLSQHHALPDVRTALNLLPGCEWTGSEESNQNKRANLGRTLGVQEQRYYQQFIYAKRSMTADQVTVRGDGYW